MSALNPSRPLSTLCRRCRSQLQRSTAPLQQHRAASSQRPALQVSNYAADVPPDLAESEPRWKRTPAAMKAPVRVGQRTKNDEYPCNEDPLRLDDVYRRVLGRDGAEILSEEIKWLAVTHKSFDHGRRGFNDRLAFLGKRIVELQTSLALLHTLQVSSTSGLSPDASAVQADQYGRVPFTSPSTQGIENLQPQSKASYADKKRLAQLAESYGLEKVIRWKPRQIRNLQSSGIDTVLAHTLYAIVGAVALQKGGEAANVTVRERILAPLGL